MKMKTLLGLVVGAVLAVSAGTVWAAALSGPGPIGQYGSMVGVILPRTKPYARIYSVHRI